MGEERVMMVKGEGEEEEDEEGEGGEGRICEGKRGRVGDRKGKLIQQTDSLMAKHSHFLLKRQHGLLQDDRCTADPPQRREELWTGPSVHLTL